MAELSITFRDEIAIVTLDNPPVNALSQRVRAQLLTACKDLGQNSAVKAVVLVCAGRTFVAGADIKELGQPSAAPFLPDVLRAIEHSPKPWVAAINGAALGGGLELAMACHGRIAHPSAPLGLPEVTLGIIPGAGGTVRLPRLVEMSAAISLVTSGKPIKAKAAAEIGLIDAVAEGALIDAACDLAGTLAQSGTALATLARDLRGGAPIDWDAEGRRLAQRSRGAAAPLEALAALRVTASAPADEALAGERARFLRLSQSTEAAALRHIFFAERKAGKTLREVEASPADLTRVGVIGGGTMGAGIATALLQAGVTVRLIERDEAAAQTGQGRVLGMLQDGHKRGLLDDAALADAQARLSAGADYSELADCGLVIEAVFEDMAVKRAVFERLDAVMPVDAILATNTSYLDVDDLAAQTRDPARVLGLHFFSPAQVMKLLEVVRGASTGKRALATGSALAKVLKKVPVVARVCDGFIGNRIMATYRRDCEFMLEEGASPQQIDAAMRGFGFAMGLYEVQDMSGLDIAWAQRKARAATRDPAVRYAHIADRMCEAGRLGRKAGRGWYDYSSGKAVVDPEVEALIAAERVKAGRVPRDFSEAEIVERILSTMQAEGAAILRERIAECADDIDVVMVLGYGFPRHKGGPMFMARPASS